MKQDCLTEAIAALYEAAALPDAWPTALHSVANATGAAMGQLLIWDSVADRQALSINCGIDPAEEARYARHYGMLDPHRRLLARWPTGRVMVNHENIEADFVGKSEFYQDFLIPAGSGHVAAISLTASADRLIVLGLHRHLKQEPFLQPSQDALAQLAPHFVRAAALYERLEPLRRRANVAAQALDALSQGAVLVGAGGRIVLVNQVGEAVLHTGAELAMRQGRLIGCDPDAADALVRAVARATAPSVRERVASAFPSNRAGSPSALLVLVVPIPERAAFAPTREPVALVLIEDPSRGRSFAPDLLRQLFGLTPAEAALAVELLSGKWVDEIAAERKVGMPTVRTQLQAVLAKTGCDRQSELLRLLGSLATVRHRP